MGEPETKRKKPNFYVYKKRKQFVLETGLKGFLCTCNFREKECIREAYNILNTYADSLNQTESNEVENTTKSEDKEDISDELAKELNALKQENEKPSNRRFQVVESGAKNILFIRTTLDNPVEITTAILNDILQSKQQKTRYLLRLVPIEITCKANMDDIKKSVSTLIEKYFCGEAKTFAVCFNHRNNNQIDRDEIIKEIASSITVKNPKHKVDLKNAELTIVVEVIRGFCLLSVIPDYTKLKKYNLLQLFESLSKDESKKPDECTTDNLEKVEK